MAKKFGIKPIGDEEDWTILWTDTTIMNERMSDIKRYQVRCSIIVALELTLLFYTCSQLSPSFLVAIIYILFSLEN